MDLRLSLSIEVEPAPRRGIVHLAFGGLRRTRMPARPAALPCRMNSITRVSVVGGLERLARSEAVALLRECRRILTPDGRLTVDVEVPAGLDARRMQPADAGKRGAERAGTAWLGRTDECEQLTRRLRDCRWVSSEDELRELASQVGLTSVPDQVTGREGEHTAAILEFTKQLTPVSTVRPLVSVLIPAFKPRFFAEAVESVRAQTYDHLEILICDDCPTSEIQEMVDHYAAGDSRVKYFRNESRLGSRQNHIRCLSLASGELIKFLSDDDRLHPKCLERMVASLIAFPEVSLVTSHRRCIDEAGRELLDLDATLRPVSEDSRADGAALARAVLLQRVNAIGEPSTTMFRRRDLVDTRPDLFSFGGRRYETIGDVVMWLNLLSKGDAIYLVETLSCFRLHPDQEQRTEHVRSTAVQSWTRMRVDAARMGLIPEDAPTRLQWTPLTADLEGQTTDELARDGDPRVLVLLGRREKQAGNLEAASEHFMHASAVASDLPCAHAELATVMHRLGREAEAEAAAARALTLNPSDAAALAVLAELGGTRRRLSGIERAAADPALDGGVDHWPAANQLIGGLVDVQGWLVCHLPPPVEVHLLVDGCTWPAWGALLTGPDMRPAGSSPNPMSGYYLMLDTRNIPDGRHVITVVARCAGRTLILGERPFVIRNRELLGSADGPAGELVEQLVRERDTVRLELEGSLEALAQQRDSERLELEGRLDALARDRNNDRLELEGRLDALARDLSSERLELQGRLEALAHERDAERRELEGRLEAVVRHYEAKSLAAEARLEKLTTERDDATAQLHRVRDSWPVRLYGRVVRLPGAEGLLRRVVGLRH
jgi:tetratricopeptide (TPR) repeat protein